jgi:uncharacterized heparinase superfamily protein
MYPKDKSENIQIFSIAGYTIIRDENAVLTFDHGPLGMAPFYNHGHADALSITLAVGGQSILVDPGTYRYNGEPQFRKYFKGTRAHNTVTVDGQDQAIQETGVIWSHPYHAELMQQEDINGVRVIQATHDGYLRYRNSVRHIRSLFIFDGTKVIIEDKFSGKGTHKFELNYHLHPDVNISKSPGNWWRICKGEHVLYLKTLGENNFQVRKGERDPVLGWFSHSYGLICETFVLNTSVTGEPNELTFVTGIGLNAPFDIQDLTDRFKNI